ncbi:hypothetical protein DOM22_18695 [Bdellovibrio sp. ZAP7]|uniref:hypothetical protein n=1 Tax=Bdellovibrio sp. ZAP7 TaxID=2231053 RepID=UPI001158A3FD|nr:hypothetical protein [Bdellovibrio sp. ZAP7]QDK47043.1 hypothetical protein DOM22_18695 [Bdellovibrio sp. ZAP7]
MIKTQITKSLFVFAAFLFSQSAFSSATVESEFELVLPKQFQQNLIEEKWKSLVNKEFQANWQFPDQMVEAQDGVQVQLKGLSLALKTQLQKPDLGSEQTQLILQSKDLSAQMTITSISVDQWIERTVNGITGRFHLQASCSNVVMNMKPGAGSFSIAVSPEVASSTANGRVEDVSLSWKQDAWSTQAFTCTGADGFDQIVNQQISQISMDSAAFVNPKKALLLSYLNDYIGKWSFDLSTPRELVSARSDVKMSMVIDSFNDTNPDQVTAKGRVIMNFTRSSQNTTKTLALSKEDPKLAVSSQAMIRLPGGLAKEIITQSYAADSWVHQFYSTQISGFSTVMNSRFMQWFVWPELMDYPKSSKFLFNVYSNKDPKVTGSGLKYQVNLNLLSQMQAPKGGNYIPFMNFVVPFNSNVTVGISESKASVKFTNTTLDLKYSWDPSYVKKYSPKTRFAASTIEGKILGAISGKTMDVTLPAIPVMEGVTLKIKKATSLSNSDLLLQLAP